METKPRASCISYSLKLANHHRTYGYVQYSIGQLDYITVFKFTIVFAFKYITTIMCDAFIQLSCFFCNYSVTLTEIEWSAVHFHNYPIILLKCFMAVSYLQKALEDFGKI